jgi:AraC-like DNA-binding protein
MWETFKKDLLKQRAMKIVSAFYCDPSVAVRPATDAERAKRIFHTHREMREILVVLDGECEYLIGSKIYQGGVDTAIIVPPQIPHEAYYPDAAPHGRHLWILLMPNFIQFNLFVIDDGGIRRDMVLNGAHCFSPGYHEQLIAALDRAEQGGGSPELLAELSLLINLQVVRLISFYREALQDETHSTDFRNRALVNSAKEYIDLQCGRDCGIDLLAKRCGCSRTHFTRIFRRYAGCSVLEYINRQRLKRYLSIHHNAPVKILAQELGFSSASSFIHWRRQNVDPELYVNYPMLTKPE